jgi:hypothetical protein
MISQDNHREEDNKPAIWKERKTHHRERRESDHFEKEDTV